MTTATKKPRALSAEDLGRMLGLIKGADSVELKLTVPESDQRSAINALGMDPLDAQIRQVFFYDTPGLTLNKMGLVVRARRIQGKGGDSVVKLRPIVPEDLSADLRKSPAFGVEVDAMPGGYVCSASLKGKVGINDAREVAAGSRPIRKLFSKAQRAFFSQYARDGISLDDLSVLGRSSCSSSDSCRRTMTAHWWPSCGCILTIRGSSSFPPSARRAKRSRLPPRRGPSCTAGAWTYLESSRRRRRLPWSSSRSNWPRGRRQPPKHDSVRISVSRRARIVAGEG